MNLQKFIRILLYSLLFQTVLLVSIWKFIFSNMAFLDFASIASAVSFALVLFFSSSGDAWTNNVIADSFIVLGDSGHREQRAEFELRVNPILISSLVLMLVTIGLSVLNYYLL
ncbi:hypothetical protein [Cytobacillus sp. FSL R5-0596]|uniref:hypothetical protein n=1 Tax=Cytobacillus sp. FSL R5-0596 TaxID=2954696 RepID=UPI0030F6D8CF